MALDFGQSPKKKVKQKSDGEAGDPSPISTRTEQKQVEERLAIGAHVVYETIRREGEEELSRPAAALAWSGLVGRTIDGIFLYRGNPTDGAPARQFMAATGFQAGYSVGFLIVILGRQQLFTDTLTVILPLLARKDASTFLRVLRLWGIVLSANLVGTFLFALCVARMAVLEAHAQPYLMETAQAHIGTSFGIVLLHAVFAGWLIALMVWLLPAAESAKVSIIILITYLVGIGSFSHIIAGSTTTLFLVVKGSISFWDFLARFFIPTLIGNIIGGVSLVAALGHAQVVGGKS